MWGSRGGGTRWQLHVPMAGGERPLLPPGALCAWGCPGRGWGCPRCAPGTGGDAPVTGGDAAGTGGNTPGTGGNTPGTGGDAPGTGGDTPGKGGVAPGTGGVAPGTGGDSPGVGGGAPGRSGCQLPGFTAPGGNVSVLCTPGWRWLWQSHMLMALPGGSQTQLHHEAAVATAVPGGRVTGGC